MDLTRRELERMVLAGLSARLFPQPATAAPAKPNSKVKEVQIPPDRRPLDRWPLDAKPNSKVRGVQIGLDVGLSSCELYSGHVEPRGSGPREPQAREELRKWRLETPLDHFKGVRTKFDKAGIELYAYNLSFRDDFTDAEMDRGFEIAKALGVGIITASSTVSAAKRIDGFARRHKIKVGMHGHDNVKDPNEYSSPESFARAMEGASEYTCVNLDIGHFTAAGFDAVDYLSKHHDRIVTLHIKDRKRDHGANLPFGEGDTPIKEVLGLLRDKKWKIPANIEYEYKGADTVAEVKKCYEYCRRALET
ncbi:MAG: sugar phosphate isomerase/epimerase [Acidobacteria bacterium]|nr:MAG: sugar phosphate isomerase/epimerase [Acidobacteriota bacterium]